MKSILLALFLTACGLWAQTPPTATPADSSFPAFPPPPARNTNQAEQLRQALRERMRSRTNATELRGAQTTTNATTTVVPGPAVPVPVVPGGVTSPNPTAAPGTTPAAPGVGQTQRPGEQPAIPALPGATNAPGEEMLPAGMIDFPGTELTQVLKIYGELKGRTILRPASLPNPQITLKTQTPLTKKEAIAAFDAVFGLNGIGAVDIGDKFVKIVPLQQAGQVGAPISKDKTELLPDLGQYVTHVVQLTNAKPSEVVQALQPFASAGSAQGILPIESSQIIVLRDFSENVKRMEEMIRKIDVTIPSEYDSEVIPIKYALASDIANALNSLSTGGSGTTVGSGGRAGGGPGAGGMGMGMGMRGGGFGRGMMGGGYGSYGGGYGSYGSYGGGMTTPYGSITPQSTSMGTVTPQAVPGTPTTPGAPSGSFGDRLSRLINKVNASGEIQVLGNTKIIADERTNSLLIFASKNDMKTIHKIVSQLDVVLAQVLIEAVIIEISLNDSASLGFSYLQKQPQGGNYFKGIGAINNNNVLNANSFLMSGATNAAGGLPGGFSYLASLGNDLDVSVNALAANSRARILQRPRIQTSHAVPATLFVGESRPYPQGSYYGGGAFGGYSTIQQMQIGVSLTVTPLINPDGLVVMDIQQQIDSFKGNVTIQGVGDVPITSSKSAAAKVAVRDHDTIMLGGLIETTKNDNNSGVPFLKDIPLLGYLFRSSSRDGTRSELIVLIRPTVLPTPEVAALTARAEKDKLPEVGRMETETQKEEAARRRQWEKEKESNRKH